MRNLLILVIALPLLALISTKAYLWYSVKKQVDNLAKMMTPFAKFEYGGIHTSFDGEVGVNKIELTPYLTGEKVTIGSIIVKTPGGVSELFKAVEKVKKGVAPHALDISVNQVGVSLTEDTLKSLQSSFGENVSIRSISTIGCGDIKHFGAKELYAMGYEELTFSLSMGWDFNAYEENLDIHYLFGADNIASIKFTGQSTVSSPELSPFYFMQNPLTINSAAVEIVDESYNTRRNQYCSDLQDITETEFIAAHIDGMPKYLNKIGIKVNDEILDSYRAYTSDAQSIKVSLEPNEPFKLDRLDDYAFYKTKDVLALLGVGLSFNGQAINDLDISVNTSRLKAAFQPKEKKKTVASKALKHTNEYPEFHKITLKELDKFLKKRVKIKTTTGREIDGLFDGYRGESILITQRISGGTATVPVNKNVIKKLSAFY